jgi:hypothetical protein
MPVGDQNKINDAFWENLVAEKVYDSFTTRAKAVESLQTFVKWFFGLFSSGSFLLIFFGRDILDKGTLFVWALGIALLLVGAYLAAESGFPNQEDVDVEDVESIKKGYSGAVK